MNRKEHENQIRWACRRGMLELDLFLLPFFENYYSNLSEDMKLAFQNLLSCNDPEIFAWLMNNAVPDDKELVEIVEKIRQSKTR